mgnify:CR=1 FL=1
MPYITVAKKFKEKQISIWDMLEGLSENDLVKRDTKDTITFYAERVPLKIRTRFGVSKTIDVLRSFNERYKDRDGWHRSSVINIAKSGRFSSDNTIVKYASEIWGIDPYFVQ